MGWRVTEKAISHAHARKRHAPAIVLGSGWKQISKNTPLADIGSPVVRTDELHEVSDHLHEIGVKDEHLVPSVSFDYQAVDDALGNEEPAETVDFTDAASAIKSILLWICSPPDIKLVGARAASLLAWMDPIEAKTHNRATLTDIAKQANITKQAVSKWLVELRDSIDLQIGVGKSNLSRRAYREAQIRPLGAGTHAKFKRHDRRKDAA
jgi:hypothetical protein